MLCFSVSEATVSRYMTARSRRPGPSWRTFLRNEAVAFGHCEYAEERPRGGAGLRGQYYGGPAQAFRGCADCDGMDCFGEPQVQFSYSSGFCVRPTGCRFRSIEFVRRPMNRGIVMNCYVGQRQSQMEFIRRAGFAPRQRLCAQLADVAETPDVSSIGIRRRSRR